MHESVFMSCEVAAMSEFNIDETEVPATPASPELKPESLKSWSTPRVIVSNFDSTGSGIANIPEASGGVLTS
jgi:hypothetical protein